MAFRREDPPKDVTTKDIFDAAAEQAEQFADVCGYDEDLREDLEKRWCFMEQRLPTGVDLLNPHDVAVPEGDLYGEGTVAVAVEDETGHLPGQEGTATGIAAALALVQQQQETNSNIPTIDRNAGPLPDIFSTMAAKLDVSNHAKLSCVKTSPPHSEVGKSATQISKFWEFCMTSFHL